MVIAIYGSRRQEAYLSRILRLLYTLDERGVTIIMHVKLFRHLKSITPAPLPVARVIDDNDFEADVVLSIGGDGTFLRTARWVGDKQYPIAGINTGHLGYLAAYNLENCTEMAADLIGGNYVVENRAMLHISSDAEVEIPYPYALNEAAILRPERASMISCQVSISNASCAHYQADGLLIATPTGSTGYNLSVGGPIVEPTSPVTIIAPVAAHSLTMRPLIISDTNELRITTTCRCDSYLLNIDGNTTVLPAGSCITIARAPFVARVIQKPGHTFIDTLRDKLSWGT